MTTIPFIHCTNLTSVKCNNQIQRYVWWLYEESLGMEYFLWHVNYEIFFYSVPFIVCNFMLISSLSKRI